MKLKLFHHAYGLLSLVLVLFLGLGVLMFWPLPGVLLQPTELSPTRILDREGRLLYDLRAGDYGARREVVLSDLPKYIPELLLATEDRQFYSHSGLNFRGLLRAVWDNLSAGGVVSGGSSLTQQLVRIRLNPESRGWGYKLLEMYYAVRLEEVMSKEEILAGYLNEAYFGHQAYGIAAAAEVYFDKAPENLSLAESALLVGLVKSPYELDPFYDFEAATKRQEVVLNSLEATGYEEEKIVAARSEELSLAEDRVEIKAPHFVFWLLATHPEIAEEREVRTTLDLNLQMETEKIVTENLARLEEKNVSSAAVVVLDAQSGEILTMVGSADYFDEEIEGAVNVAVAARQPGSTLKPFTYALALEKGDTSATTVNDVETRFLTQEGTSYIPRNYDYLYHGLVRYREALANSYNIAAVRVMEKVGVGNLLEFLKKIGITTLNEKAEYYGVALTLGDGEVKLLELCEAYGIFPRLGKTLVARGLLGGFGDEGERVISESSAWLISDMLSDADARLPEFGESAALSFSYKVGAKTGTTRNSRDNWVIGFTGSRVVGVWVGNADNSPMRGTSGVTGAGPIFHAVMEKVMSNQPKTWMAQPEGVVRQEVCRLSGLLPTTLCPQKIFEYFRVGTVPIDEDNLYQKIEIDTRNGLRAGESCPSEFVTEKVYVVFPLELQAWARENGYEDLPRFSQLCPSGVAAKDLAITRPYNGDRFKLDALIPDENEKIVLEAQAENLNEATWLVDDIPLGVAIGPSFRLEYLPTLGTHKISLQGAGGLMDEVWIEVE